MTKARSACSHVSKITERMREEAIMRAFSWEVKKCVSSPWKWTPSSVISYRTPSTSQEARQAHGAPTSTSTVIQAQRINLLSISAAFALAWVRWSHGTLSSLCEARALGSGVYTNCCPHVFPRVFRVTVLPRRIFLALPTQSENKRIFTSTHTPFSLRTMNT